HGDAVDAFREATVVSPTFEPAWEALISLYIDRKNNYELSLIYEEMIKKIGRRGPYLTELCKINTQERIYPTAIKYCKEAQAKNPQDADSMVYLGLAYRNSEQLEQGANTLKNAATQFTDSELAQVTYAQHLSEEKNYIDAYTHFLAATQINDKNIDSLVGLGTAAAKIKKIDESLAAFTKACKINRSAGVGLRKAASEFFKTNQKEEYNKLMELSEKCQ
ncbi:MAG TPA: hypothetical protein PLU50_05870, partial [Pseudobdellovibrionaceae bacterium]|nr:hypothetical protein [Pseudobdellovibrionaceae bacterium]